MFAPYEFSPKINPVTVFLLAVLLTIVAAIPRLYNLGGLSFYMDEETTAFASRSMAEGKGPQMPSGMPYHRALPHSWLNSLSARLIGLNDEISYRLPGAILGILTAPLIFVLARPFVGTQIAFLAALLLALSEWHIIISRQARMYAPFIFVYVATVFTILHWTQKDEFRYLALSGALFILSTTFHSLGIFAAFIPLIALSIKGFAKTPQYKLIAFSLVAGATAYLYSQMFTAAPYQEWANAHAVISIDTGSGNFLSRHIATNGLLIVQGIVGLLLGIWLGRSSGFSDSDNGKEFRILAGYLLAIAFGCLACTGQLHGAFLAILLILLLYPGSLGDYLKQAYKPLVAITVITIIVSVAVIYESGLVPGIKSLFTFPYPNWIVLNTISPGITLLFILTMLFLATTKKSTDKTVIMVLLASALFPIIAVGIFKKWAPARYLIQAHPFMLIVSAYTLHVFASTFLQRFNINKQAMPAIITGLVALSGILGGHGLVQAYKAGTVQHGESLNAAALGFPIYPDHKFPGEYVAKHRKPDDIIVAEDVLQQQWYAGKVDYWLRSYGSESGGNFLYKGKDGNLHDIYVNSIVTTPKILDFLTNNKNQKIWLITSSETYYLRDLYLSDNQRQWLETIENSYTPVFTGKDEITRVYCLNCETFH